MNAHEPREGPIVADLDPTPELERALLSALLLDPSRIGDVREILSPADLLDIRLRPVAREIFRLSTNGGNASLVALADALDRSGDLDRVGGYAGLAELADYAATAADVGAVADLLRRRALERTARKLHSLAARGELTTTDRDRLLQVESEIELARLPLLDLDGLGFSGDRLEALREEDEPRSPLPDLLDPYPSLGVLVGKPKTGKTTFAGYIATHWAAGQPPWAGEDRLPGSRALIISAEQPVRRVDATLRRMDICDPNLERETWTKRVTIVARHPTLSTLGRRLLVLDVEGVALLRKLLVHARDSGDPFGLVVLDSLSRLKPVGVEENDNDDMTTWLSSLQELAEEQGVYVILIHHVGHSDRSDAQTAGRGASAVGAVAQVVWLLEERGARRRRLKVRGNAVLSREIVFDVAPESSDPGEILYCRPIDPLDDYDPAELILPDEAITTTALAWRLAGKEPSDRSQRPPSDAQKAAARLRERLRRTPGFRVFDGKQKAKMIHRESVSQAEQKVSGSASTKNGREVSERSL